MHYTNIMHKLLLLAFVSLLPCALSEKRMVEPPIRVELQPPEGTQSTRNDDVITSWITMPVDHFDPQNNATFSMFGVTILDRIRNEEILKSTGVNGGVTEKMKKDMLGWFGHIQRLTKQIYKAKVYTRRGRGRPRSNYLDQIDRTPKDGNDKSTQNRRACMKRLMNVYEAQERYMYNDQFFGGDGHPVFILVGGEWTIVAGWLRAGNMFEMARENQGYQIYTEHRYYGATLPYTNFTTENLRFLNVDQALADLAYFILDLRKQPRFANSKIILYGGSYAGNMVLWFKQRYPHLVVGGVASSGPIKGQVDFTGYLEVVHDAFLSEGGEQCIATIRQGIQETVRAMETESGRQALESAYRLCSPLDYDNVYEIGYFSGLISWTFSTSTQQARPGTILAICNNLVGTTYGTTPMEKIGGYIAAIRQLGATSCWQINYENFIAGYLVASESRAWYYQTCTEYGYYQTAPRIGTVFDDLKWLSVDFYVDICRRAFDPRFDEDFVYAAVERVNQVFGGLEPDVNNTINIHGTVDPWHALGVFDRDLKDSSPTYTVPRASHCFDMQGWLSTDTIQMTRAQQAARRLVAQWLAN